MTKLLKCHLAGIIKNTQILGLLLVVCLYNAAQAQETNDEQVVECFFVYAPLLEAAETSGSTHLFYYAQKRIGWAGGYMQAKKNDVAFKELFENNLKSNKQKAIRLQSRMVSAIKNQDEGVFTEIMNIANTCNQALGLSIEKVPFP